MVEPPVIESPEKPASPRVAILQVYSPMRERARREGFALSNDKESNRKIYAASKARGVKIPENGTGYERKAGPESEAILDADALKIFEQFANEFKAKTGYGLTFTDALRTPEIQEKESPIQDSTHFTGRTLDIADGRYIAPDGSEITWSEFRPGHKPRRHPINADIIEKNLRPAMIQLMEEYQARGFMMVYDETDGGGHWHVYIPVYNQGPVGPVIKP